MRNPAALNAALTLAQRPDYVRWARKTALPDGITFLLEIAAGDLDAISEARKLTGKSERTLQAAASFFIEQLLLERGANSYRILGVRDDAPSGDLRRHMALLMKWLHPDVAANIGPTDEFVRDAHALMVTRAWETVKSDGRRAAYDLELKSKRESRGTEPRKTGRAIVPSAAGRGSGGVFSDHAKRLPQQRRMIIRKLDPHDLLSRVLLYFRGYR